MSASLIVLIPVVLLGLVAALCFVGCIFPVSGLPSGPFQPGTYETAVIQTNGLVALWPLNDEPLGTTNIVPSAADVAPKPAGVMPFNGNYEGTLNTSFELNQNSIVPGDSDGSNPACVSFNGKNGFVSVPFHQELNPPLQFTLEAWVQPNWTPDQQGTRAVVISANGPANVGYGIFASTTQTTTGTSSVWTAVIGTGTAQPSVSVPITFGTASYLAMTFLNNTLSLFVFPVNGTPNNMQVNGAYVQEQSNPPPPQQSTATPLFIGMGRPDMPTANMFPFNGFMQDVAVYNVALDMGTIMMHFNLGSTPAPSDGT
jgi:hypothetical protein